MNISTEGIKTLQYSAPERVEAAQIPVQCEPGPSSRLSHHKTSPILKVYSEQQLKDGADTAFAYLYIVLTEDEIEQLLQTNEAEFKSSLLSHMPDLIDCEPALMKAIKDRPYSLPINFHMLRRQLNQVLIDFYQQQQDQKHLSTALYRDLALNFLNPDNRPILHELLSGKRSLADIPVEYLPRDFASKTLTACLRDTNGHLKLEQQILFNQLTLVSKHGHFAPEWGEKEQFKAKALRGALFLRKIELGLNDEIPAADREDFFKTRLANIDNAEDLTLLMTWGQDHNIPDSQLCLCDQKLAAAMCSDLLIHIGRPVPFTNAQTLLQTFSTEMRKPNQSDENKLHIQSRLDQSELITTLREKIYGAIDADNIGNMISAFPYSEFARCYRALRHFGVADRSTFMRQIMQSLTSYDLLEQYVRDNTPENQSQTSIERQCEVDAQSNRSKLTPSIKLYSMPERDRKEMLDRMSDCYKNDLPMPWHKEERTSRQEPPSRISGESFVNSVDLEGGAEDDVFS